MEYLIRTAIIEDVTALHTIICELEDEHFEYAAFAGLYEKNLDNKDIYYLVAVNSAQTVIGFISAHIQLLLHHCGKVAEIQEMYVDPAYRNRKIGSALVEEMENKLKAVGCVSFEVTANIKRLTAHEFYTNMGFDFTHMKFVKILTQNKE